MPTATVEKAEVECPSCGWPQETEADRKYVTCVQCDHEWKRRRWAVALALRSGPGKIKVACVAVTASSRAEADGLACEWVRDAFDDFSVADIVTTEA